jgi:hypothetical protein
MANPNPNEPNFPYSAGTDNPGDNTAIAGGPSNIAAVETAPLTLSGASLTASVARTPNLPPGIAAGGSDTVLPGGMQAVPLVAAGFESAVDRGTAPAGGIDPVTGAPRESGQDEVAGASETTPGTSPTAFPEPNP